MNKQIAFLASWCILTALPLYAQTPVKEVTHQQQVWYGYQSTIKLSSAWALNFELENRSFIDPGAQHQFLARGLVRRSLGSSNWDVSLGFAYFLSSPNDPRATERLAVPELRPHLQLDYQQSFKKLTITHRYRAEWRFFRNTSNGELTDGYNTNYRFRYRIGLEYPLFKIARQPLKGKLSDEIMFNAGKRVLNNRFDQNRLYVGLSYPVHKIVNVEVGYLKWFQQRASGDQFFDRDILRLIVSHKISFKKSEEGAGN